MTFSAFNFISPELSKSPLNDLISNAISGYNEASKARYLQPSLAEALKKSQLVNKWYEPNIKSEIGLRGAQAGHLGALTQGQNITNQYLPDKLKAELAAKQFAAQNPLLGMTGGAGQVGALLYLQQHPELMRSNQTPSQNDINNNIQQLNEGQSFVPSINPIETGANLQTPNPQELLLQSIMASLKPKQRAYAPSNLGKLQQEFREAQEGHYPGTQIPFANEQEKEEFLAPYREKLGGLKAGEHYVFDPNTHEKIAVQRPYTPKERENEEGSILFNEFYPEINNGFKDFIGKDSVNNFIKYSNQYGKNPEATQKIDDLLYAINLVTAGVINEQSTLNAGKTNVTFRKILDSFPKTDIPNLVQRYQKELKLPSSAFYKANERFQNKVSSSRQLAQTEIPQYKTIYFHPEKHLKSEEKIKESLEHHSETVTIRNKKTGKTEVVSKEEARKRGIKNV
jgi:nucleoid DNA-binding protein